MARQYLYELLDNNPDLLASDSLFQQFYDRMKEEAEGQLNEVERRFEVYGKMDSTFAPMLQNIDSLINVRELWLSGFDEMKDSIAVLGIDADSLRGQWILQIENLALTRANIIMQHNAVISGEMYEGGLTNNIINGDEQNEINSVAMNDLFMQLEEIHYSSIAEYYAELNAIAQQCPYYGGEAVYRARAALELINDSLVYNDDVNCLLYGIYRNAQQAAAENNDLAILVKPNPANDYINVRVVCEETDLFYAEIRDALGQIIYTDKLKCNKENRINTKHFKPGIYTLLVKAKEGNRTYKIVILR
jgi:hypothetical protein